MHIHIHNQHLKVGYIDVIDVSASSNLQIGDNDQVLLYSTIETPPTSIQIGPFPALYGNGSSGNGNGNGNAGNGNGYGNKTNFSNRQK